MIYTKDDSMKDILYLLLRRENIKYNELGELLGISQQCAHKKVNKNKHTLEDLHQICNALGYEVNISITKKDGDQQVLHSDDGVTKILSIQEKENAAGLNSVLKRNTELEKALMEIQNISKTVFKGGNTHE